MKRIFVFGSSGQLCNQLFFYANLISFGIKNNYKVINPAFYRYAPYFEFSQYDFIIRYPSKKIKVSFNIYIQFFFLGCFKILAFFKIFHTVRLNQIKYLSAFLRKLGIIREYQNKASKLFLDKNNFSEEKFGIAKRNLLNSNILLINGYMFTAENISAHKKELYEYFMFRKEFVEKSKCVIEKAKNKAEIVIGIHIRRKDYSIYKRGIYFFNDQVYANYAHKVSSIFKENIVFIICSDDNVNLDKFIGLECILSENSAIVDLGILSNCNYIVGPPSSFSNWASFICNVPLLNIINEKIPNITLSDFKIYYE